MTLELRYLAEFKRLSLELDKNTELLAKMGVAATGTPIRYHYDDLLHVKRFIRSLSEQVELSEKYHLSPKGVVLIGLASNEPIILSSIPAISALCGGNTAIIRPSTKTAAVTRKIMNLMYRAGIPRDKLIQGASDRTETRSLINKADFVFWMGSYRVCKKIATLSTQSAKKFYIEAEGNDICLVDHGTDLVKVTKFIVLNITKHNGERCQAIRGILVHSSQSKELEERLREQIKSIVTGDPNSIDTEMSRGTTLRIVRRNRKNTEEMTEFGPTVWIGSFETLRDATNVLNQNAFGLSLYLFSQDSRFVRRLLKSSKYGRVIINDTSDMDSDNSPWGGLKGSGMYGPEPWLNKFLDRTYVSTKTD